MILLFLVDNEAILPSPNQLRHRIIIKNKKLSHLKSTLQRTTTIDDNEDEYDSDFGEDEDDDEQGKLKILSGFRICQDQ